MTRFDWPERPLSEVVGLRRGFDLPKGIRQPGPYAVLSAGKAVGTHIEAKVSGPGFAIGRATNIGAPQWSSSDFWPLNTTLYAEDFKGNSPRWLFHLFEVLDLSGFDSGSVQPMLNRNYIASVPVRIPPLAVQLGIAKVLGALDDKIATNRCVQETARLLAITVVGRHLDTCVVEDIASISRSTVSPERMADEGVTHFSLPSFDRGFAAVEAPAEIKSSKHSLDGPVVLVSKLNPRIPRIWPVDVLPAGQSVASTEFVPLTPRDNLAVGELWAALAAPAFSTKLLAHVAGTTGSHQRVRPNDLLSVPIADVRSIADDARELVRTLCRLVNERTHENRQLAATRDELLPLLMNGRITVKDAERRVEEEV